MSDAVFNDTEQRMRNAIDAVKREFGKLRRTTRDIESKISKLTIEVQAIHREQTRMRQNAATLNRTSELYKRYEKKFTNQEDQLEKLEKQIQEETVKLNDARKQIEDFTGQTTKAGEADPFK